MQACALPWKTIFVAASTAQLCLTVRVMWFSCTATKGCSKCRWGSATVCTGDWKKICLVTAEAFSDGRSPPPRHSWSPVVSRWLDLRSSAVQNCVQNMHSPVLACPRICW